MLAKNRTQKSAYTAVLPNTKERLRELCAFFCFSSVVVVVLLCSSFRINSNGTGIIIIVDCAFLLGRGECSGNPAARCVNRLSRGSRFCELF